MLGLASSRTAAALGVSALLLAACGGSDGNGGDGEGKSPEAAKSCLNDAGFDTSARTGLQSAFYKGEAIEYRGEFAAQRRDQSFLVWFLKSEDDAKGLAEVVKQFQKPPPGQPRVEGTIVLGHRPDADPSTLRTVEGCLGI